MGGQKYHWLVTHDVLAAVLAFIVMEPVTYAAHRWVMHGMGWVLHRGHHRPSARRLEANDWFPVMFAALTIAGMALATARPAADLLLPVGVGVTAYGAAYATVHDLYIHGRFIRLPALRPLEHLREAHALHHRFGGEPYGMLCPIVPQALRDRAARQSLTALAQRPAGSGERATTARPTTANLRRIGTRAR